MIPEFLSQDLKNICLNDATLTKEANSDIKYRIKFRVQGYTTGLTGIYENSPKEMHN